MLLDLTQTLQRSRQCVITTLLRRHILVDHSDVVNEVEVVANVLFAERVYQEL